MKKNTFEVLGVAGLVASLVITTAGCTPVRRGSSNLRDKTPENDRVLPSSLEADTTGEVIEAAKDEAKPLPYWKLKEQGLVDDASATARGAASTAAAGYTSYTVKNGESLSKIAYRYGLRWQDVAAANPGLNPNKLKVGQTINLPGNIDTSKAVSRATSTTKSTASAAGSTTYVVQKGDYIGKIAGKFHVRSADIKSANNLKSDKIIVGQKLVIPAKGSATKAVAPVAPVQPVTLKEGATKTVALIVPVAPVATPAPAPDAPVEPVVAPPAPVVEPPVSEVPSMDIPETKALPTVTVTPSEGQLTHTVGEGDDLFDIAIRWGVSPAELMKVNNLQSEKVAPGTVLIIPAAK